MADLTSRKRACALFQLRGKSKHVFLMSWSQFSKALLASLTAPYIREKNTMWPTQKWYGHQRHAEERYAYTNISRSIRHPRRSTSETLSLVTFLSHSSMLASVPPPPLRRDAPQNHCCPFLTPALQHCFWPGNILNNLIGSQWSHCSAFPRLFSQVSQKCHLTVRQSGTSRSRLKLHTDHHCVQIIIRLK